MPSDLACQALGRLNVFKNAFLAFLGLKDHKGMNWSFKIIDVFLAFLENLLFNLNGFLTVTIFQELSPF